MRDTTLTSVTTILQGRYELQQLLGQGGFGAVYRAYDRRLQTTVAIKETFDHASEAAQQFEFEAHLLASLRHPGLPAVTDYFME
jgi:serine/threonine protein kinase